MPSQFFGLNISYTGLLAANAALNTTANNISNAETEGYSRQHTVQEASNALRTFTTYGCAGAGVDTIAIERIRDEFYDSKFWDNASKLGGVEAKQYYMRSLENFFQDTDSIDGFSSSFNLMFNALEELQKNAGDVPTRSQFIMYAQSLCDYFNGVSGQLLELQKDVNTEIRDTVADINSIAEQIATLNKQINVIELTGAQANELRDKRALLIDKLSTYVNVETVETPIYDTANGMDTGASRYMVRIAGNQVLVDTNSFNALECYSRELNETTNQCDAAGLYEIRWLNGTDFNLYNTSMGGKLQGLIEMRDGNNTENFRGVVKEVDMLNNRVTIKVSDEYLMDLDKCTLSTHGGRIDLGVEEYYYTDWTYNCEYNPDGTVKECTYQFQLDKNYGDYTLSNSRSGQLAEVGRAVDYQGIPYYQEQLNEFVRLFARTVNDILTSDGAVDGYGNSIVDETVTPPHTKKTEYSLFRGTSANGGQLSFDDYNAQIQAFEEGLSNTITISNSSDSYFKMTAANFAVSDVISDDPRLLVTRTGSTDGASKADIIDKLLLVKNDKETLSFRGGSSSEFLQSVLSDVALNAARANNSVDYYTTMDNIIDNQRISVSGVDSDEEAVSLVKYKNAYDLASKMIQTFTEIYDRLILQTGV